MTTGGQIPIQKHYRSLLQIMQSDQDYAASLVLHPGKGKLKVVQPNGYPIYYRLQSREIMHLVASVHPSVRFFVLALSQFVQVVLFQL